MSRKARTVKRPADATGLAKPAADVVRSDDDQNTPEEDALERAARADTRSGEATREWNAMVHERAVPKGLLAERWKDD